MSDAVQVALIAGATNIIVVILARWHSSREHKDTADTVKVNAEEIKEIKRIVTNGQQLRDLEG